MKVEVAFLGSPSLTVLMVSVDVKQQGNMHTHWSQFVPSISPRHVTLCESRGGRPGFPVPNSPYGLCGHKAKFNFMKMLQSKSTLI